MMTFADEKLRGECESESTAEYSDSSADDPTFDVLEQTRKNISKLSIKRKNKNQTGKQMDEKEDEDSDVIEIIVPELSEQDQKSYEMVQKIIQVGQMERLKVEECKIYLRKHGLRLSGNKKILIQRINEHMDIINGGGEKKYPASSFVFNCKESLPHLISKFNAGDACTGDIVMFEQNVYEMFHIASRSGGGPPCGKRVVAGRIVKESYGVAKQQHTFTIEVLWSKGEKPLPPLHPLLIKGRNLYRLETKRQKWEDEGERQKMLMEKHARGGVARANREARIQRREMHKLDPLTRATRNGHMNKQGEEAKRHPVATATTKPDERVNQHQKRDLNNILQEQDSELHGNLHGVISNAQAEQQILHQRQPLSVKNFSPPSHNTNVQVSLFDPPRIPTQGNLYPKRHIDPLPRQIPRGNWGKPQGYDSLKVPSAARYQPVHGRRAYEQQLTCRYYAEGRCRYGGRCHFLHEVNVNM